MLSQVPLNKMPTEGCEDAGSPVLIQKKRMLDVFTIPLRHHSKTVKKTLLPPPFYTCRFQICCWLHSLGWVGVIKYYRGIFRLIMHVLEYDAIILDVIFSALTTLDLDNRLSYHTEEDTVMIDC